MSPLGLTFRSQDYDKTIRSQGKKEGEKLQASYPYLQIESHH